MHRCFKCKASFKKEDCLPNVWGEYNISRRCADCQDKTCTPWYCKTCKIVAKWSECGGDIACKVCKEEMASLQCCHLCNQIVGMDMDIQFDEPVPKIIHFDHFYGPKTCPNGEHGKHMI